MIREGDWSVPMWWRNRVIREGDWSVPMWWSSGYSGWRSGQALCGGGLGDAPLAAGAFDDVGGGVALTAGIIVAVAVAL